MHGPTSGLKAVIPIADLCVCLDHPHLVDGRFA